MPSSVNGVIIRSDIQAVVEEALRTDELIISTKVCPIVAVDKKADEYPKVQIGAGELLTPVDKPRTRGSSYNRADRQWTSDTYACVEWGLEEALDDADVKDLSRFFDYEVSATRWLTRQLMIGHEVRVSGLLMNTSNFSSANSLTAYTEANIATMDFPADVLSAIDTLNGRGEYPNTIVLSQQVLNRLKRSTKLQSFIRGAMPSDATLKITAETIANAFSDNGITQVLVGRTKYNTGKKAGSLSLSNVWSNNYVWVGYVNPNAGIIQDAGAAATLTWNQEGGIVVVETYRSEERRSTIIRVRHTTAEKVINGNAGQLIVTQWA